MQDTMPRDDYPTIETIVGCRLSAVSFVCNYVELHFDGPVIRAMSNPIIDVEGIRRRFPDQGTRDALCSLIGKDVAFVEYIASVSLTLKFRCGEDIVVPLVWGSFSPPEALHYQRSSLDLVQVLG